MNDKILLILLVLMIILVITLLVNVFVRIKNNKFEDDVEELENIEDLPYIAGYKQGNKDGFDAGYAAALHKLDRDAARNKKEETTETL